MLLKRYLPQPTEINDSEQEVKIKESIFDSIFFSFYEKTDKLRSFLQKYGFGTTKTNLLDLAQKGIGTLDLSFA